MIDKYNLILILRINSRNIMIKQTDLQIQEIDSNKGSM